MRLISRGIKLLKYIREYFLLWRKNGKPEYDTLTYVSQLNSSLRRIAFYDGCEDNRSERYRVHNIVKEFRSNGIAVDIYRAWNIHWFMECPKYDLVVFFREDRFHLLHLRTVLKHLKKMNIPVIYDTDDFTIEHRNTRFSKNILKIISLCDAMTVTTSFLARLFSNVTGKNVYVIKNTINIEQILLAEKLEKYKTEDWKIRIAYQSGTNTHNKDFEQIEDAILFVLEKYENVEFHIFGPLTLSSKFELFFSRVFNYAYVDYLSLEKLVSRMDINIAPLVINDFNNSKSELKIFEAALLKIPTVCSPIEPYSSIVDNGVNGFIAKNVEDWKNTLSILIENKDKRIEMGIRAFEKFVPMYDIKNEFYNINEIYEKVAKRGEDL